MSAWEKKARAGERWSEIEGRAAIAAWKASGDTVAAFARDHGVDPQRIGWWRKRLAEGESVAAALVPVTIAASRMGAVRVRVDDVEIEIVDGELVSPEWVAALALSVRRGAR